MTMIGSTLQNCYRRDAKLGRGGIWHVRIEWLDRTKQAHDNKRNEPREPDQMASTICDGPAEATLKIEQEAGRQITPDEAVAYALEEKA
jgi:hypothetical protein